MFGDQIFIAISIVDSIILIITSKMSRTTSTLVALVKKMRKLKEKGNLSTYGAICVQTKFTKVNYDQQYIYLVAGS